MHCECYHIKFIDELMAGTLCQTISTTSKCTTIQGRSSLIGRYIATNQSEARFTFLNQSESLYNNTSLHKGRYLDIGSYPNEVRAFHQFLPNLTKEFRLKPRFLQSAHDKLTAARKTILKHGPLKELTWVGVHNRY